MAIRLRVQFLIPLKYNNGKDIEQEKLFEVREKVVGLFGGITIHPFSTEGIWISPTTKIRYYDLCKMFEVSIDKSENTDKILKNLKEDLKIMFEQEEIYMVYNEITQI